MKRADYCDSVARTQKSNWGWLDSNQRIHTEAELQSAAIGHYATPPKNKRENAGDLNAQPPRVQCAGGRT